MFLFKANKKEIKPVDSENPEAKWVPKEKVAKILSHPKDKKFYLSVLKKI